MISTKKLLYKTVQKVASLNFDILPISRGGTGASTKLNAVKALEIFPVGAIYMSTSSTNPSSYFGGTWVAWGSGKVPVGVDTEQTEFATVELTGGEKTHTLTVNEIPSHNHSLSNVWSDSSGGSSGAYTYSANRKLMTRYTERTGGGKAHNNLQPYITCYMWKRTA